MSELLGKDLNTTIAKFHFLCSVPIIDIPPPPHDQCAICHDTYNLNDWQLGGYVHRPVILACGHILGLQCLARWITSSSSVNTCPLCRAPVVYSLTMMRDQLQGPIRTAFARLEAVAILESNGISRSQLGKLFEALWSDVSRQRELCGWKDDGERIIVAWEEFFKVLCGHTSEVFIRSPDPPPVVRPAPAAPGNPHLNLHRRALVRRIARMRFTATTVNPNGRVTFSVKQVRIALFVAMVGITYVPSAYFYDLEVGYRHTFAAMLLSAATFWICIVATRAIMAAAPGLPETNLVRMLAGPLVGVALGVGVRMLERLM